VRLAVFTNQFPGRTVTFFARDMRALLEAGVAVDIFPFYPPDALLWRYVPDLLSERVLPRERIHYVGLGATLAPPRGDALRRVPRFMHDAIRIGGAALRYGVDAAAKSAYVALKAWAWAQRHPAGSYDHVLAYWGNYSATAAYLFHRLTDPRMPFSMIVHARMDLYRKPVYLAQKMLYADNIFLVCEFNRGYIRDKYAGIFPLVADKIRIHHLGLDLGAVRYEPDGRPPCKVLAVGRLERLKGFDNLLRAAQLLRRKGLGVEVELIGGGEEEGRLKRLALDLGIAEHVRLRGWLPPDAVVQEMRRATLLVHPAVALDAMPTVLKEAMAVGTPVVAADLAGIPEILDQGRAGVLVPPREVPALADAIERLLADEALRRRYAEAARRHVERHFDLWTNGRRLAECLWATPRRPG
jgi:colanic acid/amylovoran biosynthesis glycosyltransferase